ncbi:MAG: NAD-glutamate dehydrogenase domain-containing protein [Pseudomonadota bacterium]|nr:NAD-glutamate dehydrogenase domain-containing protein [Pseudomonadota bacterium]
MSERIKRPKQPPPERIVGKAGQRKSMSGDKSPNASTWINDLKSALITAHGESEGLETFQRFQLAFPTAYRELFSPRQAVVDIKLISLAADLNNIQMRLDRVPGEQKYSVRFKIFNKGSSLPLSDVLPVLENMGLKVIEEVPYVIRMDGSQPIWMHDFGMVSRNGSEIGFPGIKPLFEDTFERVWNGEIEDDGFNSLVTYAGLHWRQVMALRAYCKFLRQARTPFSEAYMIRTFTRNVPIIRDLLVLFRVLLDPDGKRNKSYAGRLRNRIERALDEVRNIDEDRILRCYLNLVEVTLRTNFFQTDDSGRPKPYLSFKFDSENIVDLPTPRPMREIFLYSPRVEGVHLRGGKVARGGIRWSDRREDFRTEVLGLMKAQMTKNAVIVAVGAKGGFVLKKPPTVGGPKALQAEGLACYKILIRGLLDITDNLCAGEITPPHAVVCRDGVDPYLVVAADKGTATFSDVANGIAAESGFWLDDAFASGGSKGYDHKKMGITARGAWVSVKRHFREMGLNTQTNSFSVVGVGDMSGDVFGNGMLLSKHINLVAAFNHLHIFVDPNPDPAESWRERKRLFRKTRSTWSDYNRNLISKGGGVFERSAKALSVSPQMQALLNLPATASPNEVIRAILLSQTDLLWLGGIGTYIKSSQESDTDVGDRTNDNIRVDARELRCKVIGEGANLGVTQLGRIEYALCDGRVNTDFIDNSAGVASSDQEVNIKILLGEAIDEDRLAPKERDKLLVEMTSDVAEHVLMDNYRQTMALTHAEALGADALSDAARFMRSLEQKGILNRASEFLPDDEKIDERKMRGTGLTRPEIAVLLAYAKMALYKDILETDLPDDRWLVRDIGLYFPPKLAKKYKTYLGRHRLRREITSTYITNSLVNRVGPTFINDMKLRTGADTAQIVRAYLICRRVFGLRRHWSAIEALDNVIPAHAQTSLHFHVSNLARRGTMWFAQNLGPTLNVASTVDLFEPGIKELARSADGYMSDESKAVIDEDIAKYQLCGVPTRVSREIAHFDVLYAGCDIVRIHQNAGYGVSDTAKAYFYIGARFNFDWLRQKARNLGADNEWQVKAISSVVDDLYEQQVILVSRIITNAGGISAVDKKVVEWEKSRAHQVARLNGTVQEMRRAQRIDISMLSVANRHIRRLIGA